MGKKLLKIFKKIGRGFLDIIYEKESSCILCKSNDSSNIICDKCMKKIVRCNKSNISYGYYEGNLKQLILKFKYEKDFNSGRLLAEFLRNKIENSYNCYRDYYFVYIPISKKSYKERGFNQCEYLANEISFYTGNKVLNILARRKQTGIQKILSRSERIKNMKNAFYIKNKGSSLNKKILVIDDVTTTGATLKEAERVLLADGAKKVKFITIATSNF